MKQYVDRLEDVNRELDDANLNLLETLGAVVDAYDVYTYGHSVQVSIYAQALAEKMHLPSDQQDLVFKAALVHDIGKVGVIDSIIGKQGKLTDEEYNEVKRHPLIGAGIVERMKGLQELVPLVRSHHEHWDGKGYPDGLAGAEIPVGAQILTLADTIDAMSSDRPYRPTRSFKEVKDEIVRNAGPSSPRRSWWLLFNWSTEKGPSFFKNSAVTVDRAIQVGVGERISTNSRYLKKSMLAKD